MDHSRDVREPTSWPRVGSAGGRGCVPALIVAQLVRSTVSKMMMLILMHPRARRRLRHALDLRALALPAATLLLLGPFAGEGEAQARLFSGVEEPLARRALPDLDIRGVPGIATVRSRPVRIDFDQLAEARAATARADAPGETTLPPTLSLNLFDDVALSGVVERTALTADAAGYVLSGRVAGVDGGTWRLLVYDEVILGTVTAANETYNIRTVGGVHVISQTERTTLPLPDRVLPLPDDLLEPSPDAGFALPPPAADPATSADDDTIWFVDVAVVYTPEAASGAAALHGRAGIQGLVAMMIDSANDAYRRSGVLLRLRLVWFDRLPCSASKAVCANGNSSLRHLRDTSSNLLWKYGADLLSWIVDIPNFGGVAYHGGSLNVVQYDHERNHYTFAHELGHNMYLNHDRWAVVNVKKGGGYLNDPHPWSHGYVSDTCQWRTIMAYFSKCGDFVKSLVNFSNPAKYNNGERMGVSGDSYTFELDGPADAVRALNSVRRSVHYRREWPSGTMCDVVDTFNNFSSKSVIGDYSTSFWGPDCRSRAFPTRFARYFRLEVEHLQNITISLTRYAPGAYLAVRRGTETAGPTIADNLFSTEPAIRIRAGRLGPGIYTIEATSDSLGSFEVAVETMSPFDLTVPTFNVNVDELLVRRPLRLTTNVRNLGPGFALSSRLFYERRRVLNSTWRLVGSEAVGVRIIRASGIRTERINLLAPGSSGIYEYRACVRATDISYLESDTDNNCSRPARVTVTGGPDLVVGPAQVTDNTLDPGQSFTLSMSISNEGQVNTWETKIRFHRSIDAQIETSDTEVGESRVQGLGINMTTMKAITLNAPSNPGTYYYGGCVDFSQYPVPETNASNNCSIGVAVTVGGGTPDRDVLVALYNATGGPGWTNNTDWLSDEPITSWHGVYTDGNGRVTGLDARGNGLAGQIPPEFGALARLDWVYFGYNALTGQIPAELSALTNLRLLELSGNRLSGEIPAVLGGLPNLENLYLGRNQLTGWIPPELGGLAKLEQLNLDDNQLVGAIPRELADLSNLRDLVLKANKLEGPIPVELGELAQLEHVTLDIDTGLCLGEDFPVSTPFGRFAQAAGVLGCDETGGTSDRAVLEALYNVTGGPNWTVNTNWLSESPISEWAGVETDAGGRVVRLDLDTYDGDLAGSGHGNNLKGPIPAELGGLSNLVGLGLGGNELRGGIPASLGRLTNLELVELHFNRLSGAIPAELANLTRVTNLRLDGDTGLCLASDFPLDSQFAQLAQATHNGVGVCRGSGPDLIVRSPSVNDDTLTTGESFTWTAEVLNQGAERAGATRVRLYRSVDQVIPQSDLEVVASPVPSLDAGAPGGQSISLGAPLTPGTYYYGGCVDGVSGESNTTNNCSAVVGVTVSRPASRPPERVGTLAPLTIAVDDEAVSVEVSGAFRDPDGDTLTYGTSSSAPDVAWVSTSGSQVTVTPLAEGALTVTVTATDVGGSDTTATQALEVTVTSSADAADRAALEAFYDATGGAGWANSTNWKTEAPLGEWHGVVTDADGRVTWLTLGGNGLRGRIPAELASLANLGVLSLWGNELSGPIPAELGGLAELKELDLTRNALSGPIPAALSSLANLGSLSLHANRLSGPIPAELGGLANLKWVHLAANELSGPIPAALGDLANLRDLYLGTNALSGPIPAELGNLGNLEELSLELNELSGPIPAAVGNLANLQFLSLRDNDLTDRIPAELGNLANLEYLWLGDNDLTGPIPAELGNLANLEALILDRNSLTGPLPSSMTNLTSLLQLYIYDNAGLCAPADATFQAWLATVDDFVGDTCEEDQGQNRRPEPVGTLGPLTIGVDDAPAAVEVAGAFQDLDGDPLTYEASSSAPSVATASVSGSSVTVAPVSAGTATVTVTARDPAGLSAAQTIAVTVDRASGPASDRAALVALYNATGGPMWRRNFSWNSDRPLSEWAGVELDATGRVIGLRLGGNNMSGSIPGELGSLANLRVLEFEHNALSGPIPGELGSLANLRVLAFDYNALSGPIPGELGNLGNLEVLSLDGNDVSGPIPGELGNLDNLRALSLAGNALSGPIPGELGSLSNLERLVLAGNALSGPIPGELGSLSNLERLVLAGNALNGPIPRDLGSLSNLERLSLSDNTLSGPIPRELGSLSNLDELQLAGNTLSGAIPGELGSLSNLERLSLSDNTLSGPIPRELGSLSNLERLSLYENTLSGPIPRELGSLISLRDLWLGANNLSGPIPGELGSLSNLEVLALSENDLSGPIPGELGSLINLTGLGLHENTLSGPIPGELGSLVNLEVLALSENDLSGRLPSSMTNVRQLELLWIYANAGLCAPADAAFQAWLETIEDFQGDICAVNLAPQPVGTIPAQTLREGDGAVALNVAAYFQDPDGDPLTYVAVSSNGGIVAATVSGSTVSLTPVSAGTATVTVTARDPAGSSATQTIAVTVGAPSNRSPEPVGRLAPLVVGVDEASVSVEVSGAFRDPDGDRLTYGASSSTPGVARVSVSGSRVTVTPVSEGTAAVTVTATDTGGSNTTATQVFTVTVSPSLNQPPEPVGSLAPLTVGVDEAAVTVEVSGAFRDPDGDRLTYGASSSAPGVARVSVSGSRVTVTSVSEGTATVTVTATDTGGSNTTAIQVFTVTVPRRFTDHPIVAGVTPLKAVHFTELRTRIDGVRVAAGLARFPWTDPVLRAGVTPVRLVHLLELRSALAAAYAAAGRSGLSYTDASPVAGSTPIRAAHLMELRAAVVALEGGG